MRQFAATMLRAHDGSVMIVSALMLPVLIGFLGGVLSMGLIMLADSRLQAATDAAALGVAKELQIINAIESPDRAQELALAFLKEELGVSASDLTVTVKVDETTGEVRVIAQQQVHGYILAGFLDPIDTLTAAASAKVVGKVPVCVIGLNETANHTIRLNNNARMTGRNCAIYSNSTAPNGLKSKDSAVVSAGLICSAGGKDGSTENFDPQPLTDCPIYEDPLVDRPAPEIGACIDTDALTQGKAGAGLLLDSGSHTLAPGTYCGGITIGGSANVELEDGVYVIKDGPLSVKGSASLKGEQTSFYFTGAGAVFQFEDDTAISLGAMANGTMAGLLFFEDRNATGEPTHEIFSKYAGHLLGTVYLPKGKIHIGGDAEVGQDAAYTAIVAQKLELDAGPHVILNTNYDMTDVPVPDGIYGSGSRIMLTR